MCHFFVPSGQLIRSWNFTRRVPGLWKMKVFFSALSCRTDSLLIPKWSLLWTEHKRSDIITEEDLTKQEILELCPVNFIKAMSPTFFPELWAVSGCQVEGKHIPFSKAWENTVGISSNLGFIDQLRDSVCKNVVSRCSEGLGISWCLP